MKLYACNLACLVTSCSDEQELTTQLTSLHYKNIFDIILEEMNNLKVFAVNSLKYTKFYCYQNCNSIQIVRYTSKIVVFIFKALVWTIYDKLMVQVNYLFWHWEKISLKH